MIRPTRGGKLRRVAKNAVPLILVLLVMTVLLFLLVRASGDPRNVLLPEGASPEAFEGLGRQLGLDKPLPVQFLIYVGDVLRGDFGTSFRTRGPVIDLIGSRIGGTLKLGLVAFVFTVLVAIPLGLIAALGKDTWRDAVGRIVAFLGQSTPNFWVAIVFVQIFSVRLGWVPAGGSGGWRSYVLPALTMSMFAIAGITRVLRSSTIEVLNSDYILLARSKGLSKSQIVRSHVLRNAFIPTITYGTLVVVQHFLTGAIVIETVFAWPGIGRLLYDSLLGRDFPTVQGIVVLLTAMYALANMAVDLMYVRLDPRISE